MKIKMIKEITESLLEMKANEFLADLGDNVVSVQYQLAYSPAHGMLYTCMIVYKCECGGTLCHKQ